MRLPIKILHLGLGKFHRAHQAVYFQALSKQEKKVANQWGIVAFSMRSSAACDELRAVDHHYPVIEFNDRDAEVKWINSISESYFAITHFNKLMEFFCNAQIEIVSLTITEKGYLLNSKGRLNTDLVQYDIAHPEKPHTAIGMLFLGLKMRKLLLKKPLAVLSCDNLHENGNMLKQALLDYAMLLSDKETKNWIEKQISFPNCMVDRMVPTLTNARKKELQTQFSINNQTLLLTESFSQWVIEDNFKTERPPLDKVGVQFVPEVKPFAEAKLYLLNAAHSMLAYAGINKNYTYVHEAICDPSIKAQICGLFKEVIPLLSVPASFDLIRYTHALIKRFENSALQHPLTQIAMDGSQKLPQRIFPSLKKAHQMHSAHQYLDLIVQHWIQYLYLHTPDDPLKNKIMALRKDCQDFDDFKKRCLSCVF